MIHYLSRGMRPTSRARELRDPLNQALEFLEQAISPSSPFNPIVANQTWRIAAADYGASTILLPILASLRSKAPNTKMEIINLSPSQLARQAEQGDFDLAFHIRDEAPLNLRSKFMFTEHYVLTGRVGHPELTQPLTLDQFCKLDHAIVSPVNGSFYGITDNILGELGLARQVALSVPNFLFLESVLIHSNLVAMLPLRLVINNSALQYIHPPLDVPGFEMLMLWTERVHRDPAHQWLREYITEGIQNAIP